MQPAPSERPGRLAILTIVSNNYLAYARTLMQSVARQHPEADRYTLIVDRDLEPARRCSEDFTVLSSADVGVPDGEAFFFRYTILEANTAVKPWGLQHLLDQGYQRVCYIDPDIALYHPLQEVMDLLEARASMVLTPHLLAPVSDDSLPGELEIRRAGSYNLGFIALAEHPATRAMLHWWQGKLRYDCVNDAQRGIFVDQSWMDLVPGLFADVAILRHPGYNVAYWNLAQRPLKADADGGEVLGQPLVFFHFSGLDPQHPEPLSKHQNRYTLADLPALAALVRAYAARVCSLDQGFRQLPYGYGFFDDGERVLDAYRAFYRRNPAWQALLGARPFASARPYHQPWLDPAAPALELPVAVRALWESRPDLQRAFAISQASGCRQLLQHLRQDTPAGFPAAILDLDAPGLAPAQPAQLRAERLFMSLLGRLPSAGKMRLATRLCRTRPGALLLAVYVILSAEGRRPGWRQRWRQWLQRTAAPTVVSEPCTYWLDDADSREQGIWVGPCFTVVAAAASSLHIEGQAPQAGGELRILWEGRQLASLAMPEGRFHLHTELHGISGWGRLSLHCTQSFIPAMSGLGADLRRLSWRLQRLRLGADVPVDSQRSPIRLERRQQLPAPGIDIVGYVHSAHGVGEAARSMARAAAAGPLPYRLIDMGFQTSYPQTDHSVDGGAVQQAQSIALLVVNADQSAATQNYLDQKAVSPHRIAHWVWEQESWPAKFDAAFAGLAEIWVPSAFVQAAVSERSPCPVFVQPYCVEFARPAGDERRRFGLPEDKLLVLVMYDFNSYTYRKNPQAAIAAFRQAGLAQAVLVIKTSAGSMHAEAMQELRAALADLSDRVIIIDRYLDRAQAHALQACCDILLSLHRAEGFGLNIAEMMYLGKPVIATGWSGNMQFMDRQNSVPVAYELRPLEQPLGVYEAGPRWAEADIEHAAHALRELCKDAERRRTMGARARASIEAQLSSAVLGQRMASRLRDFAERRFLC